jgi:hypothetical protein
VIARARRTAAVAVSVLGLAACSSGGGAASSDTTAPRGAVTSETTTPSSSSTTVPQGTPVVIDEQGFSTYPDPIDPTATLGGYGVVVRNPNPGLMATGVRVVTRILDDAGTELLKDSAVLNAVMPGQKMAVGRTLLEPIADPTKLDIHVEVAAWLPPASTTGKLTVTNVVTQPVEDGGSTTTFDVTSSWQDTEDAVDATAVYRRADGAILGAESTVVDSISPGATVSATIHLLSLVPDLATTDVYVGRGVEAQTTG